MIGATIHNVTAVDFKSSPNNANALTFKFRRQNCLDPYRNNDFELTVFDLPSEITDILIPALKAASKVEVKP